MTDSDMRYKPSELHVESLSLSTAIASSARSVRRLRGRQGWHEGRGLPGEESQR